LSGAGTLEVRSCGLSDVGRVRGHNEDSFEIDSLNHLYIVADGMGGHRHGEVASRVAVDAVTTWLKADNGGQVDRQDLPPHLASLKNAIESAQLAVQQAVEQDVTLVGMGTTVVAMIIAGASAGVAHVGDSRAYRYRGSRLERLTKDHTWVGEQVGAGLLSEEQAKVHPLRNVVTRALGGRGGVTVEVRETTLMEGDLYLLCSDGLTTMLEDGDIERHLAAAGSIEEACRQLIAAANSSGGLDNITVLLVEIAGVPPSD
jgi:protein phosphatase